jgi:polysaccharide export outer membrane protein
MTVMRLPFIAFALILTGCASGARQPAESTVATTVDPASFRLASTEQATAYRIGPSDKLAIRVLQVPDLSFDEIFVDAAGYLQMPLVGALKASGLTPEALADAIAAKLAANYMRDPQVMVSVSEAAGQKVTIDGAVTKPGVYEMQGRTTLLQAVAMAEGATRVADLRSVAVFRHSGAQPTVAVFDMQAIRGGQAVDPVLLGDDVVVVDTSRLSARTQDLLQALPALSSFFFYTR